MNSKIAGGVLVGALLISGLLVGVAHGGSEGTEPTVIELHWNTRGEDSEVEHFFIEPCEESVPVCGQVALKDMPLFDQDGTEVGRQHISCTVSDTTAWFCSYVTKIRGLEGGGTGTVTALGVKKPNGDLILSVTGGTGAYENVGGHAIQIGDTGRVTFTLFLVP